MKVEQNALGAIGVLGYLDPRLYLYACCIGKDERALE